MKKQPKLGGTSSYAFTCQYLPSPSPRIYILLKIFHWYHQEINSHVNKIVGWDFNTLHYTVLIDVKVIFIFLSFILSFFFLSFTFSLFPYDFCLVSFDLFPFRSSFDHMHILQYQSLQITYFCYIFLAAWYIEVVHHTSFELHLKHLNISMWYSFLWNTHIHFQC